MRTIEATGRPWFEADSLIVSTSLSLHGLVEQALILCDPRQLPADSRDRIEGWCATKGDEAEPLVTDDDYRYFHTSAKVKQLYRGPAGHQHGSSYFPSTTFRWHAILVDQRREVL
jgi:hypothetical protein